MRQKWGLSSWSLQSYSNEKHWAGNYNCDQCAKKRGEEARRVSYRGNNISLWGQQRVALGNDIYTETAKLGRSLQVKQWGTRVQAEGTFTKVLGWGKHYIWFLNSNSSFYQILIVFFYSFMVYIPSIIPLNIFNILCKCFDQVILLF